MRKRSLAVGAAIGLGALLALAAVREHRAPALGALRPEPEHALARPALEPQIVLRGGAPRAEPPPPRFVPVSGDVPAWVAPAYTDTKAVVVYLHGMCGEPARAGDWALTLANRATLLALRGDIECEQGGGTYWRGDPTFLDYRITKAIRSVSAELRRPLDTESVVLLGYSQGAQRAEDLAWTFPKRYRRVAFMSGPTTPRIEHVKRLERIAVVRGSREYEKPYREIAVILDRAGVPTRYFELPGARHGDFGTDAPRAMTALFDYLFDAAPSE